MLMHGWELAGRFLVAEHRSSRAAELTESPDERFGGDVKGSRLPVAPPEVLSSECSGALERTDPGAWDVVE
jgi:hypothetical protein